MSRASRTVGWLRTEHLRTMARLHSSARLEYTFPLARGGHVLTSTNPELESATRAGLASLQRRLMELFGVTPEVARTEMVLQAINMQSSIGEGSHEDQ